MGIIQDVAKAEVADKLLDRDITDARFTACREAIITYRSQLSALQTATRLEADV
jgi:hypothetical protein